MKPEAKKLCELIRTHEEWLCGRAIEYLTTRGRAGSPAPGVDACPLLIQRLSQALIETLQAGVVDPPAPGLPGLSFIIASLALLKCCRRSYEDLVSDGAFSAAAKSRLHGRIRAFFDQVEEEWGHACDDSRHSMPVARPSDPMDFYHSVFSSLDFPVILLDKTSRVMDFNHAAERTFLNRSVGDAAQVDRAAAMAQMAHWTSGRMLPMTPGLYERALPTLDGPRTFEIRVKEMIDGQGSSRGTLVHLTDVTERHQTEAALERHRTHLEEMIDSRTVEFSREIANHAHTQRDLRMAVDQLTRTNAELARFAYVASHELLQPVVTIEGFARILSEEFAANMDGEAREYLELLSEAATRLHSMITNLRSYVRIDAVARPFVAIDFNELARRVLDDLRETVTAASATVTVGVLPIVHGDEAQMFTLLKHLISNGIKFRDVHRPCQVDVSAQHRGPNWQFTVRDTGIGIRDLDTQAVFMAFKRLHAWDEYPGVGMGLAMCKSIVERHGGTIWVDPTPGQGSAFHFTLPA